jgi:acetolactate synthase-1/2/3 large subunit
LKFLADQNVKFMFGYPGGAVLPLYDEIELQSKVKHILVRHEQAAIHAADALSRSNGEVGVAIVTSGPGLTNAVTGIATAYMDSIPMVIISGQVPSHAIGQDAFQEVDAVGVTRPCVKHNFLVTNVEKLSETLSQAFYIASTGRPGPVVVDIPKDIQQTKAVYKFHKKVKLRSYEPVVEGHIGQIKKAAELITKAKKPVIYSGGGVILGDASNALTKMVKMLGFPCTNTLMGLGGFPANEKLFLGMLGMHGTYEANMAMQNCDLLIAVGARFDDRVIGNPDHFYSSGRRIIHIDIDPSSISKRVKVDIPIVGDIKNVLKDLIKEIENLDKQLPDISEWKKQISKWESKNCLNYKGSKKIIKPQFVVETVNKLFQKHDFFITSDVGQHQMWAAQFIDFNKPRRWINSGGLGTMGVGLPYALGVQLAHPNSLVGCITGEASIQMCIQELSTAKQYNLPVKIYTLNNRYLGMVRQWQEFFHGNRYAESYMDALPDFVKLVESYGHIGFRIDKPEDVEPAIEESIKRKNDLVFIDFITDQTENVYPMVPGGKGLSEMILV